MKTRWSVRRLMTGRTGVVGMAGVLAAVAGLALAAGPARAQDDGPEYPAFDEVSKGYEQVVTSLNEPGFYTVWVRQKDAQMLAELPGGWQGVRQYIAGTISGGHPWAGLHSGIFYSAADRYVYWKQFDRTLALVAPQIDVRSTGDAESQSGILRHFTDRVVLSVPIVCMGPSGNPVIDLDALLIAGAGQFFGWSAAGLDPSLATVKSVKSFPQNTEVTVEAPVGDGRFTSFHYSISAVPDHTGYTPRAADNRVGYFTAEYQDFGKFDDDTVPVRYITRWNLEKADPSRKLSPPKKPIIYYVDHATPVRYRRWVRHGILMWNKAFEQVGISDAIEVYYQDESTGANMDKDAADVRYNFVLWLTNNQGTAVGPSRVHPLTGEILDADVVLTDGWIRYFWMQFDRQLPQMVVGRFSPETRAWLESRPQWDPRVRLAPPGDRERLIADPAARGLDRFGGMAVPMFGAAPASMTGPDPVLTRRLAPGAFCMAPAGKAVDMAVMAMHLRAMEGLLDPPEDGEGGDDADVLDGIPEWFVGPLLADLVAHEVGHTLGLAHNFKASSAYTMEQINSAEFKGKKPYTASVMDYNPLNVNMDEGREQGDYGMVDIGPYDRWAIQYGYTADDADLPAILARNTERELRYADDADVFGADPSVQQYDLGANPLAFAKNEIRVAEFHRKNLLDKFVKEGQDWTRARRGYLMTFFMQARAVSMMADWVGGSSVSRAKKGDADAPAPVTPLPAKDQREALDFIIAHSFRDEAYGLTPTLLSHFAADTWQWGSDGGAAWPVQDTVMGFQASVLTMLMNPTTLGGIYDNELRTPGDQDALTLPELFDRVTGAVWTELDNPPARAYTARQPMISSLRRNLQREHLERLIDLAGPDAGFSVAYKPISNLAVMQLRAIRDRIGRLVPDNGSPAGSLDAYSAAHLTEAKIRIGQVLDAQYIYNQSAPFVPFFGGGFFRGTADQPAPQDR